MKIVPDFSKIHCSKCKFSCSLPKNAKFSEFIGKDGYKKYCPVDGFEIICYLTENDGNQSKLTVCPSCFHKPPFEAEGIRLACENCPNRDCEFSRVNTVVKKCNKCKILYTNILFIELGTTGVLILNQLIGEKITVTCNNYRCKNILTTECDDISSCGIIAQKCECKAKILKVSIYS